MMRPSVAGPTGTRDRSAGVDHLGWPRTRPSVVSMAMARTVFSPRCWATSSTRRNARAGPLVGVGGLQRVQDRRQVAVELDVDDGADHLGEAALGCVLAWSVRVRPWSALAVSRMASIRRQTAPEMISISSLVICAWRVRFIWMVRAVDHVAGVARGVVHRGHLGGDRSRPGSPAWPTGSGRRCSAAAGFRGSSPRPARTRRSASVDSLRPPRRSAGISWRAVGVWRHHRLEAAGEQRDDVDLAAWRTCR